MLDRYLTWLLRAPKKIVVICVGVALLFAAGLAKITFSNDFRVYFSKDNPQLAAFEALEASFGRQDTIFYYIEMPRGDVFTPQVLSLIADLTDQGWRIPYAERVNSLTNYQHTEAVGDDLTTDYLLRDATELTPEKINNIRHIVMDEPSLVDSAIAKDGRATGVSIRLRLPANTPKANNEAVQAARQLLTTMRAKYPDVPLTLAGSVTSGVVLGEAVAHDMEHLVLISYCILVIGLLLLLRSVRGTLATLLLVTFSAAITLGIYGWLGIVLTPVAGWVPSIVMTIAVADSVHILISYFHGLRDGKERREAVFESMRINANPVFITSLTTIIGVLCLNFSDSPPYRDLGNMVAIGVLFAYLFSMSFLPALLMWLPIGKAHIGKGQVRWVDGMADWIIRHRKMLLIGISLWTLAAAAFIPRNQLTERWHEYFDKSFEQRRTIEAMNSALTGVHSIRYVFDAGTDNGVHDPAFLNVLDEFSDWYRQQPGVAHVTSLVDIQKRLNRTMHGGQSEWYRLPESRELAAQFFLLYELGLPRELNLDDVVNFNKSKALLRVSVHKTDSEHLIALELSAQQWLAAHAPDIKVNEGSSLDMIFAYINHRNIRSLLWGTLLALVLISGVLVLALRSVYLGLISLIPNLIPAILAYGTWGLLVGRVDLSASVVICMSIGIVVDDTVHFLSKYLRARREKGMAVEPALRYAFHTVGVALAITTVVLVAGFMVLVASPFSPTWVSGLLLSITLIYALVGDFFLLPPLLMALDRRQYSRKSQ